MGRKVAEKFLRGLQQLLAHRRAPWILVLLAVALASASLDVGLVADDHFHRLFIEPGLEIAGVEDRPLESFVFAAGEPDQTWARMQRGVFPWWTDPTVRLAFFRPLASATHWLDFRLWGDAGWAMHLHNLVWFGLALAVVWMMYRRFHHGWVGVLALALYALDDAHGPAVGWISNRNAMMTVALALPAVVFHDRFRRDGWQPGAWMGPLALALGLLAGESAVAVAGYLFAHAIHLDRRGPLAGMKALWPYALVIVGFGLVYRLGGYGVEGSGLYIGPTEDPFRFAGAVVRRAPMLLMGQLAFPWSDIWGSAAIIKPGLEPLVAAVAWLLLGVLAWLFRPIWRSDPTIRFFATGMILATVPISGAYPVDRLLWFVGIGGMAIVARFLAVTLWKQPELPLPSDRWARQLAWVLVGVHLLASPVFLALRSRSMELVGRPLVTADAAIPSEPDITDKTVVLVNPPADPIAAYILIRRAAMGTPLPARLRWLAIGSDPIEIQRLDRHTLVVAPQRGFLRRPTERMLRSRLRPLNPGQIVELEDMHVRILSTTEDHRPGEVAIRFSKPLEDPSLVWLHWDSTGDLLPWTPPAVGETVTLPAVDLLSTLEPPEQAS